MERRDSRWTAIRGPLLRCDCPDTIADLICLLAEEEGLVPPEAEDIFRREVLDYLPGMMHVCRSLPAYRVMDYVAVLMNWLVRTCRPLETIEICPPECPYVLDDEDPMVIFLASRLLEIGPLSAFQHSGYGSFTTIK